MTCRSLVRYHRILRAHLENALVLHNLIDEGALVFKVVDVVVTERVEEGQPLLGKAINAKGPSNPRLPPPFEQGMTPRDSQGYGA